jgi:putative glutathione S-transferase
MGRLVEGVWHDEWYNTDKTGGAFVRWDSTYRDQITSDGSSGFKAEAGRYHLYVSLACPWAHRTLIVRALKGLEAALSVSVVDMVMGRQGWEFTGQDGATPDHVNGKRFLHEVYTLAKQDYSGRVSVPVLWDKQTGRIVNNESSEIIRMLNSAFDSFAGRQVADLYPQALRSEIDLINARIYDTVNNGVYKSGFASAQDKYEGAVSALFDTLDWLEVRLGDQRWLVGNRLTEADIRLFTTLIRFDPVYHGHFKCNLRKLADYPNLWAYTRDLYHLPGIGETVDFGHIKGHYYRSHTFINPTGIVPKGPLMDLSPSPERARLGPTPPIG